MDDPLIRIRHIHVLIIEDEPLVAMLIEDTLMEAGATTTTIAVTEATAVAAAREHRPDFITSDVRLMAGTGPRAVRAIHLEHGPIPTLFITASPSECQPCDPPAVVVGKPFRRDVISQNFAKLTGE